MILFISNFDNNFWYVFYYQGRQSVPKIGRSEWGGASNFEVYQKTAPKNLFMKGYFGHEFSRRGWKSGSAFALVESLALLFIIKIQGSSSRCLQYAAACLFKTFTNQPLANGWWIPTERNGNERCLKSKSCFKPKIIPH